MQWKDYLYRCTAAITLEPLSNDIAINGSFS